MQLSRTDGDTLREIVAVLHTATSPTILREDVGVRLMRLLRADYLASFVRDDATCGYGSGISVNMEPDNLRRYQEYFQFHDPVTPRMSVYRHAAIVDQVIDRRDLERSEFYQDFLARDGLHFGINYFAWHGTRNLGDIRPWRGKNAPAFTDDDRAILDLVGHVLTMRLSALTDAAAQSAADTLTPREREIAAALQEGLSGAAIARRLQLSHATAPTHLSHLFQKLGARSRLEAVATLRNSDKINDFDGVPQRP